MESPMSSLILTKDKHLPSDVYLFSATALESTEGKEGAATLPSWLALCCLQGAGTPWLPLEEHLAHMSAPALVEEGSFITCFISIREIIYPGGLSLLTSVNVLLFH